MLIKEWLVSEIHGPDRSRSIDLGLYFTRVKIEVKSVLLTEKRFMPPKRSLMAKNVTVSFLNHVMVFNPILGRKLEVRITEDGSRSRSRSKSRSKSRSRSRGRRSRSDSRNRDSRSKSRSKSRSRSRSRSR